MDLKFWAAAMSDGVQAVYDAIDREPEELKSADDRFLDIVEPLLAIACFADAESANGSGRVFDELVELLRDMSSDRDETQGDAAIAVAIDEIGKVLGPDLDEVFIPSGELLEKFQARPGVDWIKSTTGLARFLFKLDLTPRPDVTRKRRGYNVTREWFNDMNTRYSSTNMSNPSEAQQDQG